MALNKKQQEAFDHLSKTFPKMTTDGKAKLLGIWEGESGLERSRTEAFPLFVNEGVKGFAGKFSAPFQSSNESYPNENSIVKKYKTEKGSKQTKQLLEEERNLWVPPEDRATWYKNLKTNYNIPTYDSSKTHKENRTLQNKAIDKLTPEQKKSYETEFYNKVYGSEYSTVKGGYPARGIGPIQVTGIDNIVKSLKTAAKIYNKPEWAELSKIVQNEPEKIDSLIRNNPELETALSMGYIQDNLVTKEGDLKAGSLQKINTIVNTANEGYDTKNKAYTKALASLNESKADKTSAPQFNNLPPIGSGSTYSMTPQQMESKVYPPSISDAPYPEVSDRYKMELLSKPNVNSREGVKRVQAQIGADVDGIWGKQSQALFDIHNRQVYDNKVRPPSDTYRQEGFQRQAPRNPSLVEQGVNAIVPSAQAAAMPVAPPEKQYMTMEELLIDKDLMQNPLLFNDEDAKRMWLTF